MYHARHSGADAFPLSSARQVGRQSRIRRGPEEDVGWDVGRSLGNDLWLSLAYLKGCDVTPNNAVHLTYRRRIIVFSVVTWRKVKYSGNMTGYGSSMYVLCDRAQYKQQLAP